MPFSPTALGATMSWSELVTNFADLRTWMNDIPATDVDTGAVPREAFVRPVINGFLNGSWSSLQEAYVNTWGLGEPISHYNQDWGPRRKRLSFVPYLGNLETWHLPIGRTVRLHRSSQVEVLVNLEWQTRSGTIEYPNGAGGPANAARCGYFSVSIREKGDIADTEPLEGQQHVYHAGATSAASVNVGFLCAVETLAAGTYDFGVVYHRSAAPTTLDQIDVGRATMVIEVT